MSRTEEKEVTANNEEQGIAKKETPFESLIVTSEEKDMEGIHPFNGIDCELVKSKGILFK